MRSVPPKLYFDDIDLDAEPDSDTKQRARQVVASFSADADECREFLAMLGLGDEEEPPAPKPKHTLKLVDATQARQRIADLQSEGRSLQWISRRSGVSYATVAALARRESGRTSRATSDAILKVEVGR